MNTPQILREAAARIERGGWWREGDMPPRRNGYKPECAAIAIVSAGGRDEALADFVFHLTGAEAPEGDAYGLVVNWNDKPGRTEHEVLSTLRAAADHFELETA